MTEIPSDEHEKNAAALIRMITDVNIHELSMALGDNFSEEEEEEYFEDIWGDEVFIDHFLEEDLLDTFTMAHKKSLVSNTLIEYPKAFHNNLKRPTVYWNEEAENFIKKNKLLEYHIQQSKEVFDQVMGFVTINEYSLF